MQYKELIYKYWGKTELGRRMIASNNVSESDLFFLIPNNVKRMHGFPPARTIKKKKAKYKEIKKHHILTFDLFDLLEEIIEETLPKEIQNNLNTFVEIRDIKGENV